MISYELSKNTSTGLSKAVKEQLSRQKNQRVRMFTVNELKILNEYVKTRLIFEDEVDLSEYKNEMYPVLLSVNFGDVYTDYISFYMRNYKSPENLNLNAPEVINFMKKKETNQELISSKKFTAALSLVVKKTKNINLEKSKGRKLRFFGVGLRSKM